MIPLLYILDLSKHPDDKGFKDNLEVCAKNTCKYLIHSKRRKEKQHYFRSEFRGSAELNLLRTCIMCLQARKILFNNKISLKETVSYQKIIKNQE